MLAWFFSYDFTTSNIYLFVKGVIINSNPKVIHQSVRLRQRTGKKPSSTGVVVGQNGLWVILIHINDTLCKRCRRYLSRDGHDFQEVSSILSARIPNVVWGS